MSVEGRAALGAERWTTWLRRTAALAAVAAMAALVALAIAVALTPLPAELEAEAPADASVRVLDRGGHLLREARSRDGARARFVRLAEMGDLVPRAILAAEDKRFFVHFGLDPLAMVRAFGQAIWQRRIVSGASTLTQQLARSFMKRPRTALGKLREITLALRIEASLTKPQVLEAYLNRAPFGPALRGIEAASRAYFGKSTRDLSLAEAALLAGMPRGPYLYDPAGVHQGLERCRRRRDRVLGRMRDNGFADRVEVERAAREPIVLARAMPSSGAPHFSRALLAGALGAAAPGEARVEEIATTLDRALQREAEVAALATVRALSPRDVSAAAIVVLENATGEVLAYVGSPEFGNRQNLGENDGVLALRQPGSALKPFVYGLAFEQLGFTAATVLPDVELHLRRDGVDYHPQNYDGRYHGPVSVREALANSYNIPAVHTASLLGPRLVERLRALGFATLDRDASHYGPALALGDGEVRLLDLANAYATLARGGLYTPTRVARWWREPGQTRRDAVRPHPVRIMPAAQTAVIDDILRDRHARASSFGESSILDLPFAVAVKTGTSKGFRDNWTVGYTPRVTVAVWVGNFDGRPMRGVSGVTGAGPLFRAVMTAAHRMYPPNTAAARGSAALELPGDSPEQRRDAPEQRGDAPEQRGDAPEQRGDAPEQRGDAPELRAAEVCVLSGALPTAACPHRRRELFADGTAPQASCSVHTTQLIDRRNGLLATARCPQSSVVERTFERFDPVFATWSRAAARPLAPLDASPLCGPIVAPLVRRTSVAQVAITYPLDGATFAYDEAASSQQLLTLRATAPPDASEVRFHVDGQLATATRAPFVARWALARGAHELYAEADGGERSVSVRFTVQQ